MVYLPFWVISIEAKTSYKGVFERISPPIVKDGKIQKEYNWLVLAREASGFPTREYDVPLAGKIPYDFRKIEGFAKVLNSEIRREEAFDLAKQQIEAHHRYLLRQDIDRIIEIFTEINVKQAVYLHAPLWFVMYEYKGKTYQLILDGAAGMALKGEIPSPLDPPAGCYFHPRCPDCFEPCRVEEPQPLPFGEGRVACHAVHQRA